MQLQRKCTILFSLGWFLFLGAALSGCNKETKAKPNEILIGAIFTLSGATSETGSMYAAGVRDSIRQVTEQGGIDGLPVRLIEKDSHYFLSKAISGYKDLKKDAPIVAIMSWGTGETEALAPMIRMDNIPCISGSFSHTLANPKKAPNNFIGGATYQQQFLSACKFILERFKDKERKPRVVLIYSDTAFGRAPFFQNGMTAAMEMGIDIVDQIIIGLDETDATLQLADLEEVEADFVIVHQTVAATAVVLKDAKKIGLKIPMIGLGWTMDETLVEIVEDAAEGFYGAVTHPVWLEQNKKAADRIIAVGKQYGHPAQKLGKNYIIGYCNGQILIQALKQCSEDLSGSCVRKKLESLDNFNLPLDEMTISFNAKRHYPATPVWIFQIHDKSFVPVGDPYLP